MLIKKESALAVIGGGRWGQVILSVLESIPLPFDRVVVVSKFNAAEIRAKFNESKSSTAFSLTDSIENLLAQYNVTAAIIVNSARQHFDTALNLIDHGAHVLIEKPIALSQEHINALIEKAAQKKVCLFPGLCYRFCSYLDNFSEKINQYSTPRRFMMNWFDVADEIRHGKLKKHDTTIDVAHDVMPHVWTILSKIFREPLIDARITLSGDANDDDASFEISLKGISGQVNLSRRASARERSILIESQNNTICKIDFSSEPGTMTSGSEIFSADTTWNNRPSPLTQQLRHFFLSIETGSKKDDIDAAINSVRFSESASIKLQEQS